MIVSDQLRVACAMLCVGIVTVGVCLPLIYQKIPMNRFYGIRIPQAFASAERWYAINAYGGRLFARWSCPMIVAGLAGLLLPLRFFPAYAITAVCVILVSVLAPLVQIIRWARATGRTN
jgi:uncharacterized membrane protein